MKSGNQPGQGWFIYSGFAPLVHPLDERGSRQPERGSGKCVGDSNRANEATGEFSVTFVLAKAAWRSLRMGIISRRSSRQGRGLAGGC